MTPRGFSDADRENIRVTLLDVAGAHFARFGYRRANVARIAEESGLGVSAATIRADMAALEDAGLITQPHTSAGRTPTVLGYSHYARKFIPPKQLPDAQRRFLEQRLQGVHGDSLLQQIANGKQDAMADLCRLVYDDLRNVARGLMRGERASHTLQPTALVNEALLRLLDAKLLNESGNRTIFFGAAARAMRQVLVDYARARAL
jgi:AcrR family transcriptional regulator